MPGYNKIRSSLRTARGIAREQAGWLKNDGLAATAGRDIGILKKKFGVGAKKVTFDRGCAGSVAADKRVSAVIPNYNYERYLTERIDSVLAQTYPVAELIILDDCSTDGSVRLIKKYMATYRAQHGEGGVPMRLIRSRKNSGSAFAAWARAFKYASGDYVWICEADDSCHERFLETVMRGFDDPATALSYCESLTMDEKGRLQKENLRDWIDIFGTGRWDRDYICDGRQEVAESMCVNCTIANVSSAVMRNFRLEEERGAEAAGASAGGADDASAAAGASAGGAGDASAVPGGPAGDTIAEILKKARAYRLAGDWYTYVNVMAKGKIAYFHESLNYHRMTRSGITLTTARAQEYEEIVRVQEFALAHFDVTDEAKERILERRKQFRRVNGLDGEN